MELFYRLVLRPAAYDYLLEFFNAFLEASMVTFNFLSILTFAYPNWDTPVRLWF
jgi:hypothetical protein